MVLNPDRASLGCEEDCISHMFTLLSFREPVRKIGEFFPPNDLISRTMSETPGLARSDSKLCLYLCRVRNLGERLC